MVAQAAGGQASRGKQCKHACLFMDPLPCSWAHRLAPRGAHRARCRSRDRRSARGESGTRPARTGVERRAVGRADPRPRLEHRAPDRPSHLDRRGRAAGRHRRRCLRRGGGQGHEGARVLRRPGCRGAGGVGARRAARPVAERAGGARGRVAGCSGRGSYPLVRAADERRIHGDRPDHGDLGARPGHRRRPRGRQDPHRPAAARRPDRGAGPRLRLPGTRHQGARGGVPGRTDGPWRGVDRIRGRGCTAARHRAAGRLLPSRHPARPPRRPRRPGHRTRRRPVARHRPGVRRTRRTGPRTPGSEE